MYGEIKKLKLIKIFLQKVVIPIIKSKSYFLMLAKKSN